MKPNILRGLPVQIVLSEASDASASTVPNEIQLLRVSSFQHEKYGKVSITKDTLIKLKENFEKKVRGIDIAIDYGHETEEEAAAWIKEVYLSEDGTELWAKVDWTPRGKTKVEQKEFRYISPDFSFNYKDNEKLTSHGPTLLGAGLTNRPVVKGMAPAIELSEFNTQGSTNVDDKDKKIQELEQMIKDLQTQLSEKEKMLSDSAAEAKKLQEEKQMSERTHKFDLMLSEGKVCAAQKDAYLANDMEKFLQLAEPLNTTPRSQGGNPAPKNPGEVKTKEEAEDKIIQLSEGIAKEKSVSIGEATTIALRENPELAKLVNG